LFVKKSEKALVRLFPDGHNYLLIKYCIFARK
jgi:hypothetical protein